jgi:hypothetical protein
MNNEAYRYLDKEEIITEDHYYQDWQNKKIVLIPSNDPYIGKEVSFKWIFEKVYLEDFRLLNDNEIVNKEHFLVWRDDCDHLVMCRCCDIVGHKAIDVRKANNSLPEFNLYAKQKTQFNFETLNILKDIKL